MSGSDRNFGYDSISKKDEKNQKTGNTLFNVVKFHFDNALSKTKNFIIFLTGLSAVFALLLMGLQYIIKGEAVKPGFDLWWSDFTTILAVGNGESWGDRLINFLFWAVSVITSGTVE